MPPRAYAWPWSEWPAPLAATTALPGRPGGAEEEESALSSCAMSAGEPGRRTARGASETTPPKSRAEDGVGSRSATGPNTSVGLWMKFTEEQSSKAAMTAYRCNSTLNSMAVEREGAADFVRVEEATRALYYLTRRHAHLLVRAGARDQPTSSAIGLGRSDKSPSRPIHGLPQQLSTDGNGKGRRSERARGRRGDKKELGGGGAVFIYSRTVSVVAAAAGPRKSIGNPGSRQQHLRGPLFVCHHVPVSLSLPVATL
jgi:hypothetical protein